MRGYVEDCLQKLTQNAQSYTYGKKFISNVHGSSKCVFTKVVSESTIGDACNVIPISGINITDVQNSTINIHVSY